MRTLQERISQLIEDIEKTKIYKTSLIYQLYNEAYKKSDRQSTCGSCLKSRVQLLKKWLINNPIEVVEELINPDTTTTIVEYIPPIEQEEESTEIEEENIMESQPTKRGRKPTKNNLI